VRELERSYLTLWRDRFNTFPGINAQLDPDPTQNPLDRLKITVDATAARITAWDLVDALARSKDGYAPVIARDHEAEQHFFFLDPCNLHPGEEQLVLERVVADCHALRRTRCASHRGTPQLARLIGSQ